MNQEVKEEQINEIIEKSKLEATNGEELLEKMKQTDKQNKPELHNEKSKVRVGELGNYDYATQEDIDEVFDKVDGIVFKMKKCMFRISYVNKGQRKFTVELINEKKEEKI